MRSRGVGPHPKQAVETHTHPDQQHLPVHQVVGSGCVTCLGSRAFSQPCPSPSPGGPRTRDAPHTESTCPIQSAMEEGALATQHRVMIKCWHVFEGSADLGTAHPPQPQAPRRRRGSPACASQGAKLAAQTGGGFARNARGASEARPSARNSPIPEAPPCPIPTNHPISGGRKRR